MRIARTRLEVGSARRTLPEPLGLVLTMGALHEGHDSLLRRAAAECESIAATIFVNPTQFGRGEDFGHYPRDEAADLSRLEALGVDLVFAPSTQEVYPAGFATTVDVGPLGERLEGAARPGHFRGVATVVTILFDVLGPGRAFFGQKDGQQTIVIRRLVRDLGLPVEVVVCPTIREPDGLAISSRNRFLSAEERAAAPVLSRALARVREAYERGEQNGDRLRELMRTTVAEEDLAALDYASVADARSLDELDSVGGAAAADGALVSLAVRLPSARLIDCLYLESG